NGDGYDDFISSIVEDLGDFSQILFDGGFRFGIDDPANFVQKTIATVTLGGPNLDSLSTVNMWLPAPVTRASTFGTKATFASPGDYNGDGIQDIAVALDRETMPSSSQLGGAAANFESHGVYVVLGSATGFSGELDLTGRYTGTPAADFSIAGFSGGKLAVT